MLVERCVTHELATLSATALLTRIGTYACGSLGIIVAIKGASERTVARMDSKQHKPLPQNMQRYLLDFKRDFVDRHFGASFKVCDKFWLITTSSKSETPRFRTERGRRFGFWSNDSRKELLPLHIVRGVRNLRAMGRPRVVRIQLIGLEVCSIANYKQTCLVSCTLWTASSFAGHPSSQSGRALIFSCDATLALGSVVRRPCAHPSTAHAHPPPPPLLARAPLEPLPRNGSGSRPIPNFGLAKPKGNVNAA